ncbi:hypothetical protein ACVVHU_004667 [Escherichia coli]
MNNKINIPLEIKEINEIIEVTDRPEFTLMHRYETGTTSKNTSWLQHWL